jgi:hypothetical protein
MPTTHEEAQKIIQIIDDYLPTSMAKSLTKRLDEEVGKQTENQSLKISLSMLREYYEKNAKSSRFGLMFSIRAVATIHFLIILANLFAMIVLPFTLPWYVSIPIVTLLINLMASPISCPLTKLEDRLRRKAGMPEIRHFIKHYIVDKIRKPRV